MALSRKDTSTLRDLARRVAEVAARPEQAEKAGMWQRHNRLAPTRPMVLVFPEGSWREIIRKEHLLVTDPGYRAYEWYLRSRLYYHEHLKDDNVISDIVRVPLVIHNTGYGIEEDVIRPDDPTGAEQYNPVILSEDDFFKKVRKPEITVDWEETERRYRQASELFDGILRVQTFNLGGYWHYDLVDLFARWRGMDQLLEDLICRPEWVHRCFQYLTDRRLEILDALERGNALNLNNTADYIAVGEYGFMSGGICFTDELPQPDFDGVHVRTMDMWGHATTQVFSAVSPAMHEEFALHYEIQFLSRFGLNGYGCCEPLHQKLDAVKKIPRLRRISMSSWVDVPQAAGEIGDEYIFSRKANPAIMAAPTWDPEAVRRSIREDLEQTRGCVVELIMKDVHTVLQEPYRLADWVRIAKEESERFAGTGP